ncbi:beta-glucosidase BglX [uncultured Dysgonomonas sp.]|uniref:Periplasmic beta-glucosidase n=1 Tax=uncultured Dysgonomonas sp. TaxID=206096 RepID=A0A212K527_9BACT|nr:beta-glucosidase BglX [uncultured Dysgonomonas sp.]SBW06824.1 Periplasmic beta-glucosidase [uncultured Dysgonomonas sp.]
MKFLFCIILSVFAMGMTAGHPHTGSKKDKEPEMNKYINNLIRQMTVEEKIGQLNLISIDGSVMTGPVTESATGERIAKGEVGALLNIMSPPKIRELQDAAVKNSRLGIPLLFGMDVIHGYNTVFPISLGLSATWNPESIEKAARISAIEASAQGVCWTFSPMVDISYDARWGRVAEGNGEDPYLSSEITKAYIRGYQGDLTQNDQIMACVKHFALYGAPEAGKDYNTVDMSRMRMFNEYFPPFEAAVKAGVGSIMTAFNDVEGVPAAANEWLLKDILQQRWSFNGLIVSDWDAVREMTVHGIGDLQEVSARALNAGLDMDMASQGLSGTLKKSLAEGKVKISDIDNACRRVLEAKYKLGLFNNPYKYCDTTRVSTDIFTAAHREEARRIAAESFVLLKNDKELLPLGKKGTIAVIGPLADNKPNMLGTWSFGANLYSPVSILEGLQQQVGNHVTILHAKGSNLTYDKELEDRVSLNWGTLYKHFDRDNRTDEQLEAEALEIAGRADVIVAVMGEAAEMAGEGASRTNLDIPDAQKDLLKKLKATGKPVVLLLCAGRPMTLTWENENIDAILNIWFPGTEAGLAVADVLFGDKEPEGRLTMTFPRSVGQVPMRYNYRQTGRPPHADGRIVPYVTGYIDETHLPLYHFGYGLGYTSFKYGEVMLDKKEIDAKGTVTASIEITNTGNRSGSEVVQLYIRDIVGTVTRPLKELKGFKKIRLEAGERKVVSFTIDAEMLKFYNNRLEHIFEPGEFEVMIGANSNSVSSSIFRLL